MTLVLSVLCRDTVWVVVDRRLSYGRRRPPSDDAVKVMVLETTDGVGLLPRQHAQAFDRRKARSRR